MEKLNHLEIQNTEFTLRKIKGEEPDRDHSCKFLLFKAREILSEYGEDNFSDTELSCDKDQIVFRRNSFPITPEVTLQFNPLTKYRVSEVEEGILISIMKTTTDVDQDTNLEINNIENSGILITKNSLFGSDELAAQKRPEAYVSNLLKQIRMALLQEEHC